MANKVGMKQICQKITYNSTLLLEKIQAYDIHQFLANMNYFIKHFWSLIYYIITVD